MVLALQELLPMGVLKRLCPNLLKVSTTISFPTISLIFPGTDDDGMDVDMDADDEYEFDEITSEAMMELDTMEREALRGEQNSYDRYF
jgi:hypothetical protein